MIVLANQTVDFNAPPIPFVVTSNVGMVLRTGSVPDEATGNLQAGSGEYVFAGTLDQSTQYVDGATGNAPAVLDRPDQNCIVQFINNNIPQPGDGTIKILFLDANATVRVTGNAVDVTGVADGTDISIKFNRTGDYQMTISEWPKLDLFVPFTVQWA